MKLWAVSDLHLGYGLNREALQLKEGQYKDDWLILGGDLGETKEHLSFAFDFFKPRFKKIIWVPGNHELWSLPDHSEKSRGEERYFELIHWAQAQGVLTPEDPYPTIEIEGKTYILVSLFLLYDYSFRPPFITESQAVAWAAEADIVCMDEIFLFSDPYPTKPDWCRARCAATEKRLKELPPGARTILINHFPLRQDLAQTPMVPRFEIWSGTKITEDWHKKYNAEVVVTGHVHIKSTQWRDNVRFEEVSLGYPRQWNQNKTLEDYLRCILPFDDSAQIRDPKWWR